MKWIMIPAALFVTLLFCEYDDITDFRKRRSIENFIDLCCSKIYPQSECYLEEWVAGDLNFYVVIKSGDNEERIPLDRFIDYCQCSECCD